MFGARPIKLRNLFLIINSCIIQVYIRNHKVIHLLIATCNLAQDKDYDKKLRACHDIPLNYVVQMMIPTIPFNSYRAGWFFEVWSFVEKWSISHISSAISLFNNIKLKTCEQKSCKKMYFLSTNYKVIKFCFELLNSDQF